MDLQTRKLNLITYLAQLQDVNFFEKIENYIIKKQSKETLTDFKPFTVDELISVLKSLNKIFKLESLKLKTN